MKHVKSAGLCAVITGILVVLTGCAGTNPVVNVSEVPEDITTITFFGNKYEPENVSVIEEILSGFMEEHSDIRISYESLKGTDYYEALQKRMAAGKGDDVFMVNHDMVLELEEKGQLADLSGLSTLSSYTDRMRSQMETEGTVHWVPTTVSVFGLYCNMDLLKEHKQEVPQNIEEWKAACAYFSDKGITPIIANNDISLKTLAIGSGFYEVYQSSRQSDVFARINNGEEKLSRYLTPGFQLVEEFIKKGYIDAGKALETQKTSDDLTEFVKGKSPFMLTGAWAAGRVKALHPEFTFRVEPLPVLEDGSLLVINADTRLSVNANSGHTQAAMKFVEYFTKAENIQKFADQQSSFSPLRSGTPSSIEEIQPLISGYESGRTVIGTDGMLDLPIWNLTAEVSKKLLLGESAASAMTWLDNQTAGIGGALS